MSVTAVVSMALACACIAYCARLWRQTALDLHSSRTAERELKDQWLAFERRIDTQARQRREVVDKKLSELVADVQQLKAREGIGGLGKR